MVDAALAWAVGSPLPELMPRSARRVLHLGPQRSLALSKAELSEQSGVVPTAGVTCKRTEPHNPPGSWDAPWSPLSAPQALVASLV